MIFTNGPCRAGNASAWKAAMCFFGKSVTGTVKKAVFANTAGTDNKDQ
uniref:Uncharacterized protein n=1 Tax=uncultured Rhodospirillales bacterium HF0500_23A22 TaxID=723611 RepID=E7C5F7_9PROT|nr:hypothetical protein [uncultured Rhodospirillales bacterium HF0500_23A22]